MKRLLAVILMAGSIAGPAAALAFGGGDIQRNLLENEGVVFTDDGRVDLETCLWQPD